MTLKNLLSAAFLFCAATVTAQELNCNVEINTDAISGTNKSIFETLQSAVSDYMNTTTFSPAQFAANEKIECRLFFTIKEVSDDGTISGDLQVQSTRPVYNSSYTTTVLNFKDTKIDFNYQEGEPLIFTVNSMENQLTAILNYYAYLILALDFDTFQLNGGEQFWERLKQIVQMAQSSGEVGWKAFEDTKNRSAVVSAFTEGSAAEGLRKMLYEYHRQGLDQMSLSVDKGRDVVTKSLPALSTVFSTQPMSVALSLFRDAKLDELVNIYSKAPAEERTTVYNILEPIYPTDQDRLEKIRKGQEQ